MPEYWILCSDCGAMYEEGGRCARCSYARAMLARVPDRVTHRLPALGVPPDHPHEEWLATFPTEPGLWARLWGWFTSSNKEG